MLRHAILSAQLLCLFGTAGRAAQCLHRKRRVFHEPRQKFLHDLTRAKNAQFHNALPYPLVPSAYQRLRLAAGAAVGVRVLCPEASLLTVMPAAAMAAAVLLRGVQLVQQCQPLQQQLRVVGQRMAAERRDILCQPAGDHQRGRANLYGDCSSSGGDGA